ncbi:hypothetical protein BJV78DRAFT_1289073 [Lactifluus subvellereus]|nr:hypothetical protein BJV78DRAFT_1289073 [Lactifluus subvellereus]
MSTIYSSAPSAPGPCHVTMYPIHQSMRSEVPTWYIRDRIERFAPSMYQVLRLTKATASGSSLPKTLPISVNGLTSPICPNTSAVYSSAPSAPGPRRVTMYPIHQSMRYRGPHSVYPRPERTLRPKLTKATASGSSLPKTLPISVHGLTSPTLPTTSAIYSSAPSAPEPRRVTMYPIHQFMRCTWQPVTGQKRKHSRKEGSNAGSDLDAKHAKTKKTEGQDKTQPETTEGETNDGQRFLAPIMEGSDDDFTVASKSKPYAGDGELIDVDDDNDLDGKDASALRDLFRAEWPSWASSKGAAALFDNDDDIIGIGNAAPAKAQHQSHQNASMLFSDSDLDKTPQPKQGPATCKPVGSLPPQGRPRQASEPVRSCRQQAHDFKKPQWDEPKHWIKDEQTDKPIPPASKQWPPEACVVYPTSGDIKLTDQHSDLTRVIRGAMQALTKYALWMNAYPPIESRTKLTRQWLYAAAKERKAKIIKMRVKEDTRFIRSLQDLIFAHIGTLRSSLKDSAVKAVTGGYGLNGNDYQKVAKRMEGWLMDDNYIFLQHDNQAKMLDYGNPFHHQAIISILCNEFFQKSSSFGNMHPEFFKSCHETRPELELPEVMVALAATAVYCTLREWKNGQRVNLSFTQAAFEDIYQCHAQTLGVPPLVLEAAVATTAGE